MCWSPSILPVLFLNDWLTSSHDSAVLANSHESAVVDSQTSRRHGVQSGGCYGGRWVLVLGHDPQHLFVREPVLPAAPGHHIVSIINDNPVVVGARERDVRAWELCLRVIESGVRRCTPVDKSRLHSDGGAGVPSHAGDGDQSASTCRVRPVDTSIVAFEPGVVASLFIPRIGCQSGCSSRGGRQRGGGAGAPKVFLAEGGAGQEGEEGQQAQHGGARAGLLV